MSSYRLILIRDKEWVQLEAEAILAGRTPRDMLAEQKKMEVVLIRNESVGHGQLILLKADPEDTKVSRQD